MNAKIAEIVKLVRFCKHSRQDSGCIITYLNERSPEEMVAHLSGMGERVLDLILSFHTDCPYCDRTPP